jgi:hypothetical protein
VIVVLPVNFSLPYADDAVHSAPEIQLYLSTVNDETPLERIQWDIEAYS